MQNSVDKDAVYASVACTQLCHSLKRTLQKCTPDQMSGLGKTSEVQKGLDVAFVSKLGCQTARRVKVEMISLFLLQVM